MMKILVQIGHPAHVHFYKNFIWDFQSKGHQVKILTKDKDIAIDLLEEYNFNYDVIFDQWNMTSFRGKIEYMKYEYATLRELISFDPDAVTGIMAVALSHAAAITRTPSVIFGDTEHATLQNTLSFPFADVVCTPDCYQKDIQGNHIRYPGYHELAYLHPNRFEPDDSVLDLIDASQDDSFVILRLVSWDAAHDTGDSGFSDVQDVVHKLEEAGSRVLLTSETSLPAKLEPHRVQIPPHKMHDLMYYADLFLGESSTMAAESAVLGTPAIFVSSSRRGYTDELENKYGLVSNFSGPKRQVNGLEQALSILQNYDRTKWNERRRELLKEKIDTTSVISNQIEARADFR
ncbi:DUF354 domain-containing protein [Natronoglomus mannanivorans]|uniref:DUF354 domain-containing protein n=1 Tax=Natronoglomus mannanivorans TaxID=2979990 RepID=A0AAP2Z071_9EURY|nr:DUF354 domain-containing protein [Halobacteria archaeon AArc-xg1-1]